MVSEWGRLREVIVGRPHYRIPDPLPEAWRRNVSSSLWKRLAAASGRTMAEAMPADYARCKTQMERVVRLLRGRGVRVHRVPPFRRSEEAWLAETHSESLLLFPRDPLLAVGGRLLELTTADPKRRRERLPLRRLVERIHPEAAGRVKSMPLPDPPDLRDGGRPALDGGDCLIAGRTVLVGVSKGGSNPAGVDWLRRVLGPRWQIHAVPFAAEFPHLDCALSLVRPGLGLFCPDALPQGPPEILSRWTWIEVGREDALAAMAVNGLALDASTLLLPESAGGVAEELRRHGHCVETVPFDTVTGFGGGLRCWSHPILRDA